MGKAILISIKPKWCEMIASGEKTVEVRKTKPKLEVPFKCYIYCTRAKEYFFHGGIGETLDDLYRLPSGEIKFGYSGELMCCNETYSADNFLNGKVIGEFVCDDCSLLTKAHYGYIEQHGCIPRQLLKEYMGIEAERELLYTDGCYGWHISALVIYDKPKELCEFFAPCIKNKYPHCFDCECGLQTNEKKPLDGLRYFDIPCGNYLKKPPQSWCYVEEVKSNA